jgi:hypothetical protein
MVRATCVHVLWINENLINIPIFLRSTKLEKGNEREHDLIKGDSPSRHLSSVLIEDLDPGTRPRSPHTFYV